MIGARVNGKLVTIDYKINNGDCIEIITSQNAKGPSRDWLNIVKSSQAKNKISQWFKNELKDDNIVKGRELLTNYCKSKNINLSELLVQEYQSAVMRKYGFNDWDAVLAAIGHGALKEGQVINRMQELYNKEHKQSLTDDELLASIKENNVNKPMKPKSRTGITVKGIHDVSVRFSRCCAPVPGDEIVGFVTRGRGVSIHRTDCINIVNLSQLERQRLIDAEWEQEESDAASEKYLAEIVVYAHNRNGLLVDVSKTLTEKNIDIRSVNTRTSKQGIATMVISFEIGGKEELRAVVDKLKTIDSVIDIERTRG
jgi:GTP pyrophosphokinase